MVRCLNTNRCTSAHPFHSLRIRCPWSARLAPIWEAAAALIHSKYSIDCLEYACIPSYDLFFRYPLQTVKVARVDCTDPAVQLKCRNHHINAFPTVRVYRRGNDLQDLGGGKHEHQAYYGDRTPEAIAAFVELQVSLDQIYLYSRLVHFH